MFDYSTIPVGFYQNVFETGNPIRRAWHQQKFDRVISSFAGQKINSLLDIGCFSGTFLSLLSKERVAYQEGVDILENQINYANRNFGTEYRKFTYMENLGNLTSLPSRFDCITAIEVIEHLTPAEIKILLEAVYHLLNPQGFFILTTPNYVSTWPVLEFLLNYCSDVSYEEQHIVKLDYFFVKRRIAAIYPKFHTHFKMVEKTTSHFVCPFLASFSLSFSNRLSKAIPNHRWKFPFGNLMLMKWIKR